VGAQPGDDQIYRITFDGSVTDEPGFVAFGGQADQVSAALKERYSEGMSLAEAFDAALDALAAPANGERNEVATSLEVAVLERAREHRTFRRIRAARLEELIAESRAASSAAADSSDADSSDVATADADSPDAGSPDAATSDAGSPDAASSAEAGSPASTPNPAASADSAPPAAPEPPIGPDAGSTDRGSGTGGPPL
jgi:proteasome alpha subunit